MELELEEQVEAIDGTSLAGATLDGQGRFTWQTPRARAWLLTYREECGRGGEVRLERWIDNITSGLFAKNEAGSHLCLSRPGAQLHIHYAGQNDEGEFLVLLDEQRLDAPAFGTASQRNAFNDGDEASSNSEAFRWLARLLGANPVASH